MYLLLHSTLVGNLVRHKEIRVVRGVDVDVDVDVYGDAFEEEEKSFALLAAK